MNRTRLDRIQTDLQRASTVIYLEGKTDAGIIFELLGVPRPSSGTHKDVCFVGLGKGGQGGHEVRALVQLAEAEGLSCKVGRRVLGIVDGDGRELAELNRTFLSPHQGPLFSWPAYSIENPLTTAWPTAWGDEPDWAAVLSSYVPYGALNCVQAQLQTDLQTLHLAKFQSPSAGQTLRTIDEVKARLRSGKQLVSDRDVEAMFDHEANRLQNAIQTSLDEGHALINGKWLVSHYATQLRGKGDVDQKRDEWAKSVLARGGHPAVRELWTRITGEAP